MPRRPIHPLNAIFWASGFGTESGMNFLQDRGLIADECLEPEDVAPCDVLAVFLAIGESEACKLNPAWLSLLWDTYEKKIGRNPLTYASACKKVPAP